MKTPISHPDSFQQTGKQPIILFALSLIFALSMLLPTKSLAQEKEAYVVIKNGEITFFYTLPENKPTENVYSIPDGYLEHAELLPTIKTATFDDSFRGYEPKSCSSWFYNFTELTTINNLQNLNTNQVEDMGYMFSYCSSLIDIDLSQFNTGKVKNMSYMFYSCSSLTELDLESFNTSDVIDMERMFCYCHNLITIDTGDGWKTQGVVNMTGMFQGCNNLNFNLINNLNTSSVQHMSYMFNSCENITKLDLSFLDTKNVLDMQGMFAGCRKLDTIILDSNKFKTDKVEDMGWMFSGCTKLNYIDFSLFNTSSVTQIQYMFNECEGFTVLDLRSFETPSVTDMHGMFKDCVNLTTILVSDDWNLTKLAKDNALYNTPIFENCPNLIGNNGTKYTDPNSPQFNTNSAYTQCHQDINYANANDGYFTKDSYKIFYELDGGSLSFQPNEFQLTNRTEEINIPYPYKDGKTFIGWIGTPITGLDENDPQKNVRISDVAVGNRIYTAVWAEAYAVVSEDNSKLTFYFDNQKDNREGTSYRIDETQFLDNIGLTNFPKWIKLDINQDGNPTTWTENPYERIIFDESFKNARPTSCFYWFNGCSKVKEIEGLQYLITDEVTNMDYMFTSCKSLTKLDLSHFNTEKVTEMNGMFYLCSGLQSLNVTSFNTENVADMCNMFIYCSNLSSLDLSSFNTEKVMNMAGMFNQCSNLNTLDLRTFNTSNDTTMEAMFWGCTNLTTILVSNNWNTSKVSPTNKIFADCKAIIGNEGTIFSDDKTTTEYARIDDLANNHPGYLTTESYKIFYDLDGDGKVDDVKQYEWESEPPLNFSIVRNSPIDIPNLKNQSGTSFIGWIGTPITGLDENNPQKNVRISDVAVGNRIYTAVWEEQPINITIPDNLIYPEKPEENDDACNGKETNVTLTITLPEGVNPSKYNLNIPDICNEEMDPTIDEKQRIFDIPISKETKPGRYDGIITLYFGEKGQHHEDSVHVTVAIDQNAILHLYEDVIFVNNHDSLYGGNGTYQWYKDGKIIPNANQQYLYDPNMSGVYKAKMYTTDGLEVYSCPIDEGKGLSKNSKLQVKTYPNPVVAGNEFTLEVAEYDPSANYTIHISNSNGVVVKEIANAAQFNTLILNRGIYSGSITSGGRKQGFKLIVK